MRQTVHLLQRTPNEFSVDVLLAGLNLPQPFLRLTCLDALLSRRSAKSYPEVIKRFPTFDAEMWQLVHRHVEDLLPALERCLLYGDEHQQQLVIESMLYVAHPHLIVHLVQLIESANFPLRDLAIGVLRDVIHSHFDGLKAADDAALHDSLPTTPGVQTSLDVSAAHAPSGKGRPLVLPQPGTPASAEAAQNAKRMRHILVETFRAAAERIETHGVSLLVEGWLIFSEPQSPNIRRALREGSPELVAVMHELLEKNTHPGVLAHLMAEMSQNYPLKRLVTIFEQRTDLPFIAFLLQRWPRRLSPMQYQNYHDIKHLRWLEPGSVVVETLPPSLQVALLNFVLSTGCDEAQKRDLLEWTVRHGTPEARTLATELLVKLQGETLQEVILEGLVSELPDIQAWATTQLRARAVPGAFELLLQRLDSEIPEVREAAKSELRVFDMHQLLELCEELDPAVCRAACELVFRVDPHALERLKNELKHPVRKRRIRAARLIAVAELAADCAHELIQMLRDSDPHARRTAIEVVSAVAEMEVFDAIVSLRLDPSPRVRESVAEAIERLQPQVQPDAG